MMILRVVALLCGAFALAGCCISGQGCYAPISTTPFAFEPSAPSDADFDAPSKKVAQKLPAQKLSDQKLPDQKLADNGLPKGTVAQRNAMAQDGGSREDEQAADREADAKLSSQLKICRGC
jgi:hypothetical protein